MGQNVGDWAKNDEKSNKGNKKTKKKKVYSKWLIFVTFSFQQGKVEGSSFHWGTANPLLYPHLSQKKNKKKKKKNIIYSMQFVLQTWGKLKTQIFPGSNRKQFVVGGHF